MTRRGSVERERYWREVIRDQTGSGLPISTFCQERKVAAGSFYAWRKKLAGRNQASTAVKFVPIQLPTPTLATRTGCEVVLPNGYRIIVSAQCEASWLREILGVVQEPSC